MSIQKRPNGSWRARYRDPDGKERARHFRRKIDAQRWLAEITTSLTRGTYVDPAAGQSTLRDFYEQWAARQLRESTTTRGADLAVRECTFADVPLAHVRRSHVEAWVKAMASTLAPATVATRYKYVHAVLRGAVRDHVLAVDPGDGVVLPRVRPTSTTTVPSTATVSAIMSASTSARKSMVAVMAFAGLRLGEAAALHVHDVVFLRRRLVVARQVLRDGIRAPKYGGERVVFLADGLLDLLATHVREHVADGGWLFPGKRGQPTPHHEGWWQAACARAGVISVSFHDLRHFYASGLIAAG